MCSLDKMMQHGRNNGADFPETLSQKETGKKTLQINERYCNNETNRENLRCKQNEMRLQQMPKRKDLIQSKFDKRDIICGRTPISGRLFARFDSFHRQNVERLSELYRQRELYACFFPLRSSNFDYTGNRDTVEALKPDNHISNNSIK
jgi:hypothetical protein